MDPDQNAIKSLVLSNIWGTKENQLIWKIMKWAKFSYNVLYGMENIFQLSLQRPKILNFWIPKWDTITEDVDSEYH